MHANKLSETWRCVYVINANKELNPLKVKKLTQFENCVREREHCAWRISNVMANSFARMERTINNGKGKNII